MARTSNENCLVLFTRNPPTKPDEKIEEQTHRPIKRTSKIKVKVMRWSHFTGLVSVSCSEFILIIL